MTIAPSGAAAPGILVGYEVDDNRQPVGFAAGGTRPATDTAIPMPIYLTVESHRLTIAPTGAGKSTGPVAADLLTHDGPVFVVDPTGGVYARTARHRATLGPVHVLDSTSPSVMARQRSGYRYGRSSTIRTTTRIDARRRRPLALASGHTTTGEHRMSFTSAIEALATALPGEWVASHRHDAMAILARADGMEIAAHSAGQRVTFSPVMPAPPGGGFFDPSWFGLVGPAPKMSIAAARLLATPERIAGEVSRKVVEPWTPMWRHCVAVRDKRIQERAAAADIARRLADVLDTEITGGNILDGQDAHVRVSRPVHGIVGDFRVSSSSGNVDVVLRPVPGWVAVLLADVIAALPTKPRP